MVTYIKFILELISRPRVVSSFGDAGYTSKRVMGLIVIRKISLLYINSRTVVMEVDIRYEVYKSLPAELFNY